MTSLVAAKSGHADQSHIRKTAMFLDEEEQ